MCARIALVILAAQLCVAGPAAAQVPPSSSFAQLTGKAGCIASPSAGIDGCAEANGLISARTVAVSPDQQHVYAVAGGTTREGSSALTAFTRDAATGALAQVQCISNDGSDGRLGTDGTCEDGDALLGAHHVEISPDGRFVYTAAASSHSIAWFERDATTGKLAQRGCLKQFPRGDRCGEGPGLQGVAKLVVSPDGRHLYASSVFSDMVIAFARDPETGGLERIACVSASGDDGLCADGTALHGVSGIGMTADGRWLYAATDMGALLWFARDAETGVLVQRGCLLGAPPRGGRCGKLPGMAGATSLALDPTGTHLYVVSPEGSLFAFTRDEATGGPVFASCLKHAPPAGDDVFRRPGDDDEEADEEEDPDAEAAQEDALDRCRGVRALEGAREIVVSGDGRSAFIAGWQSLSAFRRDPASGELRQVACIEGYRNYVACAESEPLSGASGMAASTDGRSLYVASRSRALVVLGAAVAITARTARLSASGTVRVGVACPVARRRSCLGRVVGGARFKLAPGARAHVAVRVAARVRRTLSRHGRESITVRATDATRRLRTTSRRVRIRR